MIGVIKRILKLSGKYRPRIEAAFIFSFLKSLLMNGGIVLTVVMIDKFLHHTLDKSQCLQLGGMLFGMVLLQAVCIHLSDRLQSAAGFMLMSDLRIRLGEHLRRLPMGYFTEGNIGKISSVLSTDMVFIEENVMMTLADLMSDIFSQIVMIGFLTYFNPKLGLVAAVGTVIFAFFGNRKFKNGIEDSKIRQEQNQRLTESVIDFAEGMGIIKTYNLLGEKSKELTENFDKSYEESIRFENHQVPHGIIINVIYEILSALMILVSAYFFVTKAMPITYFLGILLFAFDVFVPFRTIFFESEKLTIMDKCLDRLDSIMDEKELEDCGNEKVLPRILNVPAVEFKNVHFSYDKKEVIAGVSFQVREGETVALVGPSGSGKTTLANLLARFWDINRGSITINGKDIRNIPLAELLDHISMVFQNVYLFKDTIYNNIAMGRSSATKEQVIEAAKKARCYDFIMSLPDGFDTIIGEGGASLSGGEKQRISIARCILKDAPIVILDEATANVDADNEALIQGAITELCKGKTLIVIAHRLKTIQDADCIIVVKDGKIQEKGTHNTLMEQNGIYRSFVDIKSADMGWYKRKSS